MKFNVAPAQRVAFLFFLWILSYLMVSVVVMMLLRNGITSGRVVCSTVIQDVMVFVLPALITAVVVTRTPAELLGLKMKGVLLPSLLAVAAVICSIPLMNVVIEWNANLSLPDSMRNVEEWMRNSEARAQEMIGSMVIKDSVLSLVVMVLVVGVLAGFSEELFFRGALQRLLVTYPVNIHVAVWLSAVVFSAVHIQFYGFVPRLLLGAMFGYVALWSGSVVPAMVAHITNNVLAGTAMWVKASTGATAAVERAGIDGAGAVNGVLVCASACLTAMCLWLLWRKWHEKVLLQKEI